MEQTSASPHDPNLGYLLAQTAHRWRSNVARVLKPHELTPPQFFMLMAVYHQQIVKRNRPTQKLAAQRAALDINVASQVTKTLVIRGLVKRQPHPDDSRAYLLSLTRQGITLAQRSSLAVRQRNAEFFAETDNQFLAAELHKLMEENHGV